MKSSRIRTTTVRADIGAQLVFGYLRGEDINEVTSADSATNAIVMIKWNAIIVRRSQIPIAGHTFEHHRLNVTTEIERIAPPAIKVPPLRSTRRKFQSGQIADAVDLMRATAAVPRHRYWAKAHQLISCILWIPDHPAPLRLR